MLHLVALPLLVSLILQQVCMLCEGKAPLTTPVDISSGSAVPSAWSLTLTVEAHRHRNEQVAFNTRSYCWNDVCSYPGPTIRIKAGDNFTLTIVNRLGANPSGDEVMNVMHSPNTTNFHTHGLHIDPDVDNVFLRADPGDSLVYNFRIPLNHGSGMMWYHDHIHGSSTLKVMGGLVGGLLIEPADWEKVPESMLSAESFVLVFTRLKFDQHMDATTHTISQGCGQNWTCDPYVQSPECNATDPPVSPYDSFRLYSYYELARETGSTLDINAEFVDPTVQDMTLVNGQYQPVIQDIIVSEPVILQVIAALGGGLVMFKFSEVSASSCQLTVIAYDGVYLRSGVELSSYFRLVEGGRGDVQVVCDSAGVHDLVSNGGAVIMQLNVSAKSSNNSNTAGVLDDELAAIVRPSYLNDLAAPTTAIDFHYSAAFWQDGFNHSTCGFWMGVGTDCSARGAAAADVPPELCQYSQFSGSLGLDPAAYTARGKLVMTQGGVAEWRVHGEDSNALHPFHIHVNHFQVISFTPHGDGDADAYKSYFEIGQFRDTVPLFDGELVIRFLAADFSGEIVTHCHFLRHEDLGMMDTFLITPASRSDAEDREKGGNNGVLLGMSVAVTVLVVSGMIVGLVIVAIIFRRATHSPSSNGLEMERTAQEVMHKSGGDISAICNMNTCGDGETISPMIGK